MEEGPTRRSRFAIAAAAGFVSGVAVLGIGGRIMMRAVAYTTPEPERLTLGGTLEVLAVGAAWGVITAPLILLLQRPAMRGRRWLGPSFGVVVLAPLILVLLVASAAGGRIVAPGAFIVASAVLFPSLFLVHGAAAMWLARRWGRTLP